MITILDCYTDEPAGLGVPPFFGTYPRYLYGYLVEANYITIDDLRFLKVYKGDLRRKAKTNIRVYNLTKKFDEIRKILDGTNELYIILGVHTPGKYLSAVPGTLNEVIKLLSGFKFRKILTGPAVYGTAAEGGKFFEKADLDQFHEIREFDFTYDEISKYAIKGAEIIKQIPSLRVIEIETGKGCSRKKGCSFCTEPLKNKLQFRNRQDILEEVNKFKEMGVKDIRLGKQACFYSYPDAIKLLDSLEKLKLRTLHIDNVNPAMVVSKNGQEITEKIVKVCTSGNVAAFGVESFDEGVIKANNLNCKPDMVYEAIKIINEFGKDIGENGMPKFLPGLNILFGLENETKTTHAENMKWLNKFIDEDLLLRRINIRQVNIFENTPIYESCGNKYLRKNGKYYWKWRNEIRQKIDFPMLQKLLSVGQVIKDVRMEIYDGNKTFGRQIGTYPLVVGIKKKIDLGFYDVKVKGHIEEYSW